MKRMTLQELFDVDFPTLRENFASQTLTSAYGWAIARLEERLDEIMKKPDWHSPENSSLRNYLSNAVEDFRGNRNELFMKKNTAIRKTVSESHYEK